MKQLKISIIIPSYNGKELLKKYLPGVINACKKCKNVTEIIVVDDSSNDGTISFLKSKFPNIKILSLKSNLGFIKAVNYGVKKSKGDLVLLLNNDVEVDINFIAPLFQHFYRHKDLFAVTSKSIIDYKDKKNVIESITKGNWRNGMFLFEQPGLKEPKFSINFTCTNFHACGGFSLFDRKKFLYLEGFDDLYEPFYWEDIDLSYRAWKIGWKIFYEPESIVYHKGHSTVLKVQSIKEIELIYHRNKYLFIWKNITDTKMLDEHIEHIHSQMLNYKENIEKVHIYNALKRIEDILKSRRDNKFKYKISDKAVLKISSNISI